MKLHDSSRSAFTAGLAALAFVLLTGPARAQVIDPLGFASLGSLVVSGTDNYVFDTTAMTLRDATTNTLLFSGVSTSRSATIGGQPFTSLIAVFVFDQVSLTGGTFTVTGNRALALLSRGDLTVSGGATVSSNGANGGAGVVGDGNSPGAGGAGGAGGFKGGVGGVFGGDGATGDGPGGGGGGPVSGTGTGGAGGGFGGGGGNGGGGGGTPGPAYGDLTQLLQGGSGGGGGGGTTSLIRSAGGGGGGGGAIQLGALGNLTVSGGSSVVSVRGGTGGTSPAGGISGAGGGGSGGGIFLFGTNVSLSGTGVLNASGGLPNGGTVPGGGGGRIAIVASNAGDFLPNSPLFNVTRGGVGGSNGVVTLVATIPEPSSLVLGALAAAAGLAAPAWRRARGVRKGRD